ncbi:MAG: UDP-N-acetylmuramoyl-L-alanyl-D-glutamate--2,6-diaminopimelate ligase [Kiritimatiellia bacterium]
MKLAELISRQDVVVSTAPAQLDVTGVQCDSRRVRAGELFVAIHGSLEDGLRYVPAALSRGALAVVSDMPAPDGAGRWIQVRDARRTLAQLACALHGHPSHSLAVHGITGTNGKTTTCWLTRDMLRAGGRNPGLISTVQCEYGGREIKSSHTTPDACELQTLLASMRTAGCDSVTMEVSSHAIDQQRVGGIRFASAAFTNLSRDHLDYHHDLETYFRVKERLFLNLATESPGACAVLNADDPCGRRLIESLPARGLSIMTYGFDLSAEVCATDLQLSAEGSRFTLNTPQGRAPVQAHLLGRYNVANLLCATALACKAGVQLEKIVGVIEGARPRWGRLERVDTPLPATIFVDYAHTDDALDNVLTTLRELTRNRLIAVFGCGGNRDRTKRPIMGRVAAEKADHVVITSDNPRNENPQAIMDEIVAGIPAGRSYETCPDRRDAILAALRQGHAGDVILIAGKGHETTQEFDNRSIPFDDREQVRLLAKLAGGG